MAREQVTCALRACPLCPQDQTSSGDMLRSVWRHKWTPLSYLARTSKRGRADGRQGKEVSASPGPLRGRRDYVERQREDRVDED